MTSRFPADFRWGVATSAYQVEGATDTDGRGPTDWDEFISVPDNINRGDTAQIAADHYHRYATDLDLARGLGVDAYRMSISWTRIRPDGSGPINPLGLAFYDRLIDAALERGLEPFVTINHMELPLPLARAGGWLHRDTIDRYLDLATAVHERLSDRVRQWMTMNEVPVTTWWGQGTTWFPPGNGAPALVLPALHHQLVAHGRAVTHIRSEQPDATVGIVGSYWPVRPASEAPQDVEAAGLLDLLINRSGLDVLVDGAWNTRLLDWHRSVGGADFVQPGDLDVIATPIDAYGLNYYDPLWVAADPEAPGGAVVPPGIGMRQADPADAPRTAFDWVIDPTGLPDVLTQFRDRYQLPVFITENGIAVDDYVDPDGRIKDVERIDYVRAHLDTIADAIENGVDVRGYFAWSLLDNFEWASGYSKRFGLVFVDYRTQERIPKASYRRYADLLADNTVGPTTNNTVGPTTDGTAAPGRPAPPKAHTTARPAPELIPRI